MSNENLYADDTRLTSMLTFTAERTTAALACDNLGVTRSQILHQNNRESCK